MRSLSFSEAVVCNYSIKKLLIKFCQSSLATSLKKETLRQVYFCEFCKIPKKNILQNIYKWLILDFAHFHTSHSIYHFIKRNSKKGNYYFLNIFNRISTSKNYRQKKQLDSKIQFFVMFSSGELDVKSFVRAGELS